MCVHVLYIYLLIVFLNDVSRMFSLRQLNLSSRAHASRTDVGNHIHIAIENKQNGLCVSSASANSNQ